MTKSQKLEFAVSALLTQIGEDTGRPGLLDTPHRVAAMYQDMFSSVGQKPPVMTMFPNEGYDEQLTEMDIHFYSFCEHHLLPFFGKVHVAYLPKLKGKIVGLSKIARVVDFYSKKPQVQERLTQEIADYMYTTVKPHGVIVMVEAEHLCMSMRGIKKPRHNTVTMAIKGHIDKNEFLQTLAMNKRKD